VVPPPLDVLVVPEGVLPVATPPRYQEPMSVRLPFWSRKAAFGPTFETGERKEPK